MNPPLNKDNMTQDLAHDLSTKEAIHHIMNHVANLSKEELENRFLDVLNTLPNDAVQELYNSLIRTKFPVEDDYEVTYCEEFKTTVFTVFLNGIEYRITHTEDYDDYMGVPEWLVLSADFSMVDSELEMKLISLAKLYKTLK